MHPVVLTVDPYRCLVEMNHITVDDKLLDSVQYRFDYIGAS